MLKTQAIPAFNDNYIWFIQAPESHHVLIVDPGDAEPVMDAITQQNLIPSAILITHYHHDHIGGITSLLEHYDMPVYDPRSALISQALLADDNVIIDPVFPVFTVLSVPGHTDDHIAFLVDDHLFCGDTLFAAGCGRLLGGTAQQLFNSLQQIAALAGSTKIYCAHEYTVANLRFALAVEPDNIAIQQRLEDTIKLRNNHQISLPSTLAVEFKTNPFLRCDIPTVKATVEQYAQQQLLNSEAVFTALRKWKDNF